MGGGSLVDLDGDAYIAMNAMNASYIVVDEFNIPALRSYDLNPRLFVCETSSRLIRLSFPFPTVRFTNREYYPWSSITSKEYRPSRTEILTLVVTSI